MITFISSIGEILVGFLMSYLYIDYELPRKKMEIATIGFASFIMGMLLAYSRNYTHVSVSAVLICTLLSSVIFWIIRRENFLYIISVIWSYYSFYSVMQVFYVYWFVGNKEMVDGSFWGIFTNVKGPIRQLVYFYSLFITTILLIAFWKFLQRRQAELRDYRMVLLGFCVATTVLLVSYRGFLQELSVVEKKIKGSHFVTFLAVAIIILLLTMAFFRGRTIEKENAMLQLHDEIVKVRYQELEEAVTKNRQLVHDINNHLVILQEYARVKENEKIYQYIEELRNQYEVTAQKRWTAHPVMDFILNQKKMEAEQKQISMEIQAERGIQMPIAESEICVVLGNLLDNAIEAASKTEENTGWVKITIGQQNEMTFLKIENNYQEEPVTKNGEYVTTKENKNAHGYGIKSVKRIIKNQDGMIDFEAEKYVFSVRIMLPPRMQGKM